MISLPQPRAFNSQQPKTSLTPCSTAISKHRFTSWCYSGDSTKLSKAKAFFGRNDLESSDFSTSADPPNRHYGLKCQHPEQQSHNSLCFSAVFALILGFCGNYLSYQFICELLAWRCSVAVIFRAD
jgi:hypothetical protein